jgi:serine phosphatase RsbU (regulator of sigma subunit)
MLSTDGRRLVVTAASDTDLPSDSITLAAGAGPTHSIEVTVALSQSSARFDNRESSSPNDPLRAVGPESTGFVCPLCFGGTLVGTIAVGRRSGDFPLGRLQDEVVRTFAEFLSIQTLNLGRQRKELRNRVVERELEIAKDIQHLLLPRTLPQLAGFGLAGGWQSAREVGGDFYDAIALGNQSLLLMIADVMGKGVPAALFATTMRGLLLGLAERSSDPAELLSGLNRLLYKELSSVAMFITAQIVHVDLKTRQLTAASAGHCSPLYIPHGRHSVTAMPIQGLPLGVLPDTKYPHMTAQLGSPGTLLLYTDGLTDSRNRAGATYGQKKLKCWLRTHASTSLKAAELRDRLATELNRFRGDTAMDDDQAFLVLTEEGGSKHAAPRGARHTRPHHGSFLFPAEA